MSEAFLQLIGNRIGLRELFTSSGTWTNPGGVDLVYITACGAGGGNAGVTGGCGAGAFCIRVPVIVNGSNLTLVVGTGGTGDGGDTTITVAGDASARIICGGGFSAQTGGGYGPDGKGGGAVSTEGTQVLDLPYNNGVAFGGSGAGAGVNSDNSSSNFGAADVFGGPNGSGYGSGGNTGGNTGADGFILVEWEQREV